MTFAALLSLYRKRSINGNVDHDARKKIRFKGLKKDNIIGFIYTEFLYNYNTLLMISRKAHIVILRLKIFYYTQVLLVELVVNESIVCKSTHYF